ncbi:zinc finger BED domain-containing protein RICESLEEPER 3-like [Mangifera indica]|uniref:zinc finger BED domain-containing protein RICESLEEPER 3-like n=1 Tax=Mangifera indica TaxID=29780 RepID=UPI001CFC3519|nr:zinc finger BED domain-containing protein RICESLEEPER 3-like [Mangifera indica]
MSAENFLVNKRKNIEDVNMQNSQSFKKLTSSESGPHTATPIGSNQMQLPVDEINKSSQELDSPYSSPLQNALANSLVTDPTGRCKSIVWEHFKKVKVDGKDKAECNYCHKQLVSGGKNGTRHLHDHHKICPKRKYHDVSQKLLVGSHRENNKLTLSTCQFDQEAGRKDLANMIILHEYPLSIVDHCGFRRFCNTIQPLFKMISRNTIKKDIMKIYDVEKGKTMKLLNKNLGRIAITCDLWTASNQNKGYMTITAHFIDNKWELQNRLIR